MPPARPRAHERRAAFSWGAATHAVITGRRRSAEPESAGAAPAGSKVPSGGKPTQAQTAVAATSVTVSARVATERGALRLISGQAMLHMAQPIEKPNVLRSTIRIPATAGALGPTISARSLPRARATKARLRAYQAWRSSSLRRAAQK